MFRKSTRQPTKGGGEHGSATKTPPFDLTPDEWRRLKTGWGLTLLGIFAVAITLTVLVVVFGWIAIAWFFLGIGLISIVVAILICVSLVFLEGDW